MPYEKTIAEEISTFIQAFATSTLYSINFTLAKDTGLWSTVRDTDSCDN
jgi:hypothetical protein